MNNWQTIITFTYPQDAHMVKAFLESHEIPTYISDELIAQVNNFYSNAVGGVKLKVCDDDFSTAKELLISAGYINPDVTPKRNIELLKKGITPKELCPFCKSRNIGRKRESNILSVVLFFILGILFPLFRRSWVCFDCNKEWKYVAKLNQTPTNMRYV